MQLNRRDFLRSSGFVAAGVAASQSAPAQNSISRPNMLLLFPDQWRFDWLSNNSALPLRTPHLDALRNRGMQFDHCWCPSPLCAPSRACLALGVEYERCGVPSNRESLDRSAITFYRRLRDSGYDVLGCGKFDLNKPDRDWGLDGKKYLSEWGFTNGVNSAGKWDAIQSGRDTPRDPYMKFLHDEGLAATHVEDFQKRRSIGDYSATFPTPLPDRAYTDNWSAQNGIDAIDTVPKGKPWFMQVNFPGPHAPMDITASMEKTVRDRVFPQPNRNTELAPETHVAIRQNYTAMTENIDRWVGRYVDKLRERGELDNTLFVFSSDHGEMLGDHDLWGKSKPHEPSTGVPLIVAGPGVQSGKRSDTLVSVMDFAATFLDYAGVHNPADMDSRSLAPVLRGETSRHREFLRSALGEWKTVRDQQYKLVLGYPEKENVALYDLLADPQENRNIATDAPEIVKRLRDTISV